MCGRQAPVLAHRRRPKAVRLNQDERSEVNVPAWDFRGRAIRDKQDA